MTLTINGLNAFYGKKQILENISLEVKSGSFLALIGRNGCGKSTLAGCLSGSVKYDGKILTDNESIEKLNRREKARRISVMPQLLGTPHITVEELTAFGRNPYLSIGQRLSGQDKKIIENAILTAGLEQIRDCYLDRISGGELRRAYLSMLLAQDTPIMVLDEATAYMDADNEKHFLQLIKRIQTEQGKTILSVMHSLSDAVSFSDSIAVMENGRIKHFGSTEEILESNTIEKAFGVKRFTADNKIFFA